MSDHSIITQLSADLGGIETISDPAKAARYARDFAWFSPVLKELLADKAADLVARPADEAELARVLAACYRHRVPVTARGRGTGNYGQCTPMQGGVVLDLARLDQVRWVRGGVARAQAGALLSDIDLAARPLGWELRMLPSTYRMCSAAGFYCGGFGGVGSINYGTIGDPGNVTGVRVLTLEAEPRFLELRDQEARDLYHAYGVNGIITEIEFALAPLYDWQELMLAFPGFMEAMRFAQAVGSSGGIAKKSLTVMDAPLPELCGIGASTSAGKADARIPAGQAAALCIVAASSVEALTGIAAAHGGSVVLAQDHGAVYNTRDSLIERSWNHTTLHTLARDKTVTYLESIYPAGDALTKVEELWRHFGDEVLMHIEYMQLNGQLTCVGIPIVRYTTAARLDEIAAEHRARGVHINNPHTYVLEDGGKLASESRTLAMKRRLDPAGLLNPGKTRSEVEAARGI